jgi:hypothetical protein
MEYIYYYAYLAFFSISGITKNRQLAFFSYVTGVIFLVICNYHLISISDLEWYRAIYTDINTFSVLPLIQENDFEIGLFTAILLEKNLLDFGLHAVITILLLMPLLFRSFRKNLDAISLFFIAPGSFLLFNNVMRQGFSEFLILWGLLSNSKLVLLNSFFFHRFSIIIVAVTIFAKSYYHVIILGAVSVVFSIILKDYLHDQTIENYAKLDFSITSLYFKILIFSIPLFIYAWLFRSKLRGILILYLSILIVVHSLLNISGIMSERAVYFMLPVLIAYVYKNNTSTSFKVILVGVYLSLSLMAPLLSSHSIFF